MAYRRVTPPEAQTLMTEGYTYVDVRSSAEYQQGHPQGAVNVPLLEAVGGRMAPNPDFIQAIEALFSRDARLVLGCKMGPRSAQACRLLEQLGYGALVEMRGGFDGERDAGGQLAVPGWAAAGLPVERDAPAERTWQGVRGRIK